MYKMHNPPHPGEVLKDSVLRIDGGVTIAEFAKRLRVRHRALSRVVNGKAGVSAELAVRLAAALHGSAESWLRMQLVYDLWHVQRKKRPKIEPLDFNPSASVGEAGQPAATRALDVMKEMNSPSELARRLVELFPDFAAELEGEEIETYHQVIQRLAPRVTGYLTDVPHDTLKQFCDLVNLMADAGGDKENAISTCLLEHASQLRVRKIIRPYLGVVARRELR